MSRITIILNIHGRKKIVYTDNSHMYSTGKGIFKHIHKCTLDSIHMYIHVFDYHPRMRYIYRMYSTFPITYTTTIHSDGNKMISWGIQNLFQPMKNAYKDKTDLENWGGYIINRLRFYWRYTLKLYLYIVNLWRLNVCEFNWWLLITNVHVLRTINRNLHKYKGITLSRYEYIRNLKLKIMPAYLSLIGMFDIWIDLWFIF